MITKKQLCESIIQTHLASKGVDEETLLPRIGIDPYTIDENECFKSSVVGVAMDYLGLIKNPELKRYIASRGGVICSYIDPQTKEAHVYSLRDLLESMKE